MPKKTFFRLPQEKQQRILTAAAEEFIEYKDNYEKSSVKRIAERADIAIGSIYKYFYDKNDLFLYLYSTHKQGVDASSASDTFYAFSQKESELEDYLTPTGEILAEILLNNPLLLQDLIFNQQEAMETYFKTIHPYYQNDLENGELRDGIDEELASYLYTSLEFIAYHYCRRKDVNPSKNASIHKAMADLFFFGLYKDGRKEKFQK
ncbi:TetR/AcrR family transcriptional regulator [Ihubacter sp. mB4P-1]|uniref:TetR/AcrR family transcriptional regulator n=1 Tax=Ihubacter sp. mB4P-1 TaxID=3242370 RepID=UPI001379B251